MKNLTTYLYLKVNLKKKIKNNKRKLITPQVIYILLRKKIY